MSENLKEQLKTTKQQLEAFREENKKRNEQFFKEAVGFLFEQHPVLTSFSWTQYTPYFNDGDECTFSANIDYPLVNGIYEGEWELKDAIDKQRSNPQLKETLQVRLDVLNLSKQQAAAEENYKQAEKLKGEIAALEEKIAKFQDIKALEDALAAYEAVTETLQVFDNDLFQNLFGNHVRIEITRDKIEIEHYDHE